MKKRAVANTAAKPVVMKVASPALSSMVIIWSSCLFLHICNAEKAMAAAGAVNRTVMPKIVIAAMAGK